MRILILEDDPRRVAAFRRALVCHCLVVVESVADAIEAVEAGPAFDGYLLDHDLDGRKGVSSDEPNTGAAFCRWLASSEAPAATVVIHSGNREGAAVMAQALDGTRFVVKRRPFWATIGRKSPFGGLSIKKRRYK